MRSRILLTVLAATACYGVATAQDKNAVKFGKTITAEDATKHLSILASDAYQGRDTGKPGAEMAAQYIKKHFQSLGLTGPVNGDYFQKIDLREKTVTARNLTLNGKAVESKDFSLATYLGPKTTFTDFIFVGYGIQAPKYDDLSAADIAGKVVVVLNGEPQTNGTYLLTGTSTASEWTAGRMPKKLVALREKKPALILSVNPALGQPSATTARGFTPRPQMIMGEEKAQINQVTISPALANQLLASTGKTVEELQKAILETGKSAPVSFRSALEVDVQATYTPLEAKNVLGFMEGSDPKLKQEILVISSHYDHVGVDANGEVFNGADDDGSGTTGVLEIAEAFSKAKKAGKGPKRSILFMPVIGEEKGLLGSEWYSQHPVFPVANTIADLNIDMIGRVGFEYKGKADSANYIYVIGSDKLSSTLKKVSEEVNTTYTKMVLDYKYDDPADPNRFYYRSDHYNFAKLNIPIIFYFNGVHEDYHKITDEVKKINFPALAKRAQLVFFTAWTLANRTERPVVDRVNDFPASR